MLVPLWVFQLGMGAGAAVVQTPVPKPVRGNVTLRTDLAAAVFIRTTCTATVRLRTALAGTVNLPGL